MWETSDEWWEYEYLIHIRNTSQRPIYDLRLRWLDVRPNETQANFEGRANPLMPGDEHASKFPPITSELYRLKIYAHLP